MTVSTAWSIWLPLKTLNIFLEDFHKEDIQRYEKMATTLIMLLVTTEEGTVTDSKSLQDWLMLRMSLNSKGRT